MKTKFCSKCKKNRNILKFFTDSRAKSKTTTWCKDCVKFYNNIYYIKNRTAYLKYKKEYHLKKTYNLTLEGYNKLLKNQNYVCAICKQPEIYTNKKLFVDHNHHTNKIRGLLCSKCNIALGNFNDDKKLLKRALKYLDL